MLQNKICTHWDRTFERVHSISMSSVENPVQSNNLQLAQRNIIAAGNPSVFFLRQLCQIWGINWTHHSTVPIVPSTLDATVTFPSDMMIIIRSFADSVKIVLSNGESAEQTAPLRIRMNRRSCQIRQIEEHIQIEPSGVSITSIHSVDEQFNSSKGSARKKRKRRKKRRKPNPKPA